MQGVMSPRRYPPITAQEARLILRANDFSKVGQRGSHEQWEGQVGGKRRLVTVDENAAPFSDFILKSMIKQSGLSREKFYGSTKATAKKIGLRAALNPKPAPE